MPPDVPVRCRAMILYILLIILVVVVILAIARGRA